MTGKLILLNGASSAGKTTLCKAIREMIEKPFLHFSLDFFMFDADMLPKKKDAKNGIVWDLMKPQVIEGFYQCIAALLNAGNNLLVDLIVENDDQKQKITSLLKEFDTFIVGVHCPLAELEKREKARGDRHAGGAAQDFSTVHTFFPYDFEVDSMKDAQINAALIIEAWQKR